MDVLSRAQKNITEQPCLKLTYDLKLQGPWSTNPNHTVFGVALTSPYETIVKEEYIIYDMVAMISAIGGTMGLCIGFSFTEFARITLGFLEKAMVNHQSKNEIAADSASAIQPNEYSQQGVTFQVQPVLQDVNQKIEKLKKESELQAKHVEARLLALERK